MLWCGTYEPIPFAGIIMTGVPNNCKGLFKASVICKCVSDFGRQEGCSVPEVETSILGFVVVI